MDDELIRYFYSIFSVWDDCDPIPEDFDLLFETVGL